MKKNKILLCTIIKNENKYLKEFIDHYKNLGFTNIVLYDNNDSNGEQLNINDPFVFIEDCKDKKTYQMKAYEECYAKYHNDYDWIAFFDCDEFLYLNKHNNISEYLLDPVFDNYDIIKINWKIYGDNDIEQSDNYSVTKFTKPLPINFTLKNHNYPENNLIKSIVRCCFNNIEFQNPHVPINLNRYCNNCGQKGHLWYPQEPINYDYAELRHYYTKTINEFIDKIYRGWPDIQRVFSLKDLEKYLLRFFEYNNKTEYKEKQIQNFLKMKKQEKIKIYVLAHKEFDESIVDKNYCEIIYRDNIENKELDNLKLFYSETYMINYLYKHQNELPDYIGICHYRRYFDCNYDKLIDDLFQFDCIMPDKQSFGNQTIYDQYNSCCNIEDIKIVGAIIKKYYPEYLQDYCDIFNGKEISLYNMIIIKKEHFIEYCKLLFDILDKLLKYYNWNSDDDIRKYIEEHKDKYTNMNLEYLDDYFKSIDYQVRIGGAISERLLNVFVKYKNLNIKYYPVKFID